MKSILVLSTCLFLSVAKAENPTKILVRPIQPVTLYSQPGWEYSNYHKAEVNKKLPKDVTAVAWPDQTTQMEVLWTEKKGTSTYYLVSYSNGSGKDYRGWINSDLTLQGSSTKAICPTKPKGILASLQDTVSDFSQSLVNLSYSPPPLTADFEADGAGANCHAYIKPDGTYGPSGKLLLKELGGNGKASLSDHGDVIPDVFLNPEFKDFNNLCPNFDTFHKSQKLSFWVWLFTAIAWDEGKCIPNVTADGTNTLAVSDFQLPENWNPHRKYRGPGCNATEPRTPSRTLKGSNTGNKLMANPKNAIPCAVQIMAGTICGWYAPESSGIRCNQEKRADIFAGSSQSYWQKIRANDDKLKDMISQFPDCKKR